MAHADHDHRLNHTRHLAGLVPLIVVVTLVGYAVVLYAVRRRFADFLLTGAAATFVCATQVMPHGNPGAGGRYLNLIPLRHFAEGDVIQVLLNVLLTVPLSSFSYVARWRVWESNPPRTAYETVEHTSALTRPKRKPSRTRSGPRRLT